MAKPNKDTKQPINDRLSIQIGLSGLSFSVLDSSTNSLKKLKHFNKERNLTPLEMLDHLKYVLEVENLANNSYSQVTLIYRNELSTLVPKKHFIEEAIADYLKFNNKILASDYIAYDEFAEKFISVYVPFVNINNYIFDTFGGFTYKHFSTLFIDYILNHYKSSHQNEICIHIDGNMFEMLVVQGNDIQHYNTFTFNTKEDFIYYILFTLEQLKLDPESIQLMFFGNITMESKLYKIAFKYVRNVEIAIQNFSFKESEGIKDSDNNIVLLNSFLCESSQVNLKAEK